MITKGKSISNVSKPITGLARTEASIIEVNIKRVKNAVNSQLHTKGFEVTTDNPDFLIALYAGRKQKIVATTFWAEYSEAEEKHIREYEEGSLIVDSLDPQSKERLWRGKANGEFSTEWLQEKQKKIINEAVLKLLQNFPPVSEK